MIDIILACAISVFITYVLMLFSFKCYVEDKSKKLKGFPAFGKTYFFMTQEQIQNACKSIILTEKKMGEL